MNTTPPLPSLPKLPTLCNVCLHANSMQIVPERGEDIGLFDIRYSVFCPVCFDDFISFFPITIKKIRNRELYGKFYSPSLKSQGTPRRRLPLPSSESD